MSGFDDVRFPLALSFGATGGPERAIEIVRLAGGNEVRNARHALSRRRYDVGTGLRSLADVQALIAFFEARQGALRGFRFRDPFDFSSAPAGAPPGAPPGAPAETAGDQALGHGDGVRRAFALVKAYGAYLRPVTRPVQGSVRLAIDGHASDAFTLDPSTGLVLLHAAPAQGARVTAGFRFDVPVRFATDHLSVSLSGFAAGRVAQVPLIEILG